MRPIVLFALLFVCSAVQGQRYADISANNIKATFSSGGVFYMIDTGRNGNYSHYEVPNGSGRSTIFAAGPWLMGLDTYHQLRGAFNRYEPDGDFQFGPVASDHLIYDSSYMRVYPIKYGEIRNHIVHYHDAGYVPSQHILDWPGNGDTTEPMIIAPFIDLNGNGRYEPMLGDYPDICGDDAIFMILNDSMGSHNGFCGRMFSEIHILAYSFDVPPDSILYNTTFLRIKIISRATELFKGVRFSMFFDTDIGCPYNDRIGCDTALNSYFGYNDPDIPDAGNNICYGPPGYGRLKVAQGFTFLNHKMTAYSSTGGDPMQKSITCGNIYNWQNGKWADGTPMTVGGNGYGTSTQNIKYIYPGDPRDSTQWSELFTQNGTTIAANDRRAVGSISFDSLAPGQSYTVDMALFTAIADSTASRLAEIGVLKDGIRSIQHLYDRGMTCYSTSVTSSVPMIGTDQLYIYPVPAISSLYLSESVEGVSCTIIDVTGKEYPAKVNDRRLDISGLAAGVYLLQISDGASGRNIRFVKE